MSTHQFKPGDKKIFKILGKSIPVKVIQSTKYGIKCEVLASSSPVEKGEKVFCDPTRLFDEKPSWVSDDGIRFLIKRSVARNILKGMSIEEAFKSVDLLFEYFKYSISDLDPIDVPPSEEAKLDEAMKQISDEQIDKFIASQKNKNSVRSCANCPNLINGKFKAYGDIKNIVTCSRFGFWTFIKSIQDYTACDAIDRPVKKIADSTTKKRLKQRIHCGMCVHFTKIGDGRRYMGRCNLIGDHPCCFSRFDDEGNNAPRCREFKRRKEQTNGSK